MTTSDARGIDEATRPWSFDEFVGASVALIPAYAPDWTNHNPSDPGITLVELLAYFSEVLAYRALRVTPDAKLHFLRLLEGGAAHDPEIRPGISSARLDEAIGARVAALSHAACVVNADDFDRAAQGAALELLGASASLRTRTVIGADLRDAARTEGTGAAVADVSVILAPERELNDAELERLCEHVRLSLAARSLLTTRVHVLGPVVLHVEIGCRVALKPGTPLDAVATAIDAALRRRFGPIGADDPPDPAAADRPFGGAQHLLEVTEVVGGVEGVDWVEQVSVRRIHAGQHVGPTDDGLVGLRIGVVSTLATDTRLGGIASVAQRRLLRDDDGEVVSVVLQPWELVRVRLDRNAFEQISDDAVGAAGFAGSPGPWA